MIGYKHIIWNNQIQYSPYSIYCYYFLNFIFMIYIMHWLWFWLKMCFIFNCNPKFFVLGNDSKIWIIFCVDIIFYTLLKKQFLIELFISYDVFNKLNHMAVMYNF